MNIAQINNSTLEELEYIVSELDDEVWISVFNRMREILACNIDEIEAEAAESAYGRGFNDGREEAKSEAIAAIESI